MLVASVGRTFFLFSLALEVQERFSSSFAQIRTLKVISKVFKPAISRKCM